ncbi:MAG TPA: hypothetical protein VIU65_04550 [Pyrinomonadaceae bacterium]
MAQFAAGYFSFCSVLSSEISRLVNSISIAQTQGVGLKLGLLL